MTLKRLSVSMVGTGLMARLHSLAYTALPFFAPSGVPQIRKALIADIDPELAEAGARRYGFDEWTTDWQEVVQRTDIDIVDIVTPNHLHHAIAVAAIDEGKHVFCEKPLALNRAEAEEMYRAALEAGVVHGVGFNYRKTPAIAFARQLVQSGKLGRIHRFRTFQLFLLS